MKDYLKLLILKKNLQNGFQNNYSSIDDKLFMLSDKLLPTFSILNICLPVSKDQSVLLEFNLDLKGVACSRGSACQSGSSTGSHVLNSILSELDLKKPPPENLRNFDVVVCYHVIEHIEKPDLFFKHLSMMIKKNGILIVGTPNIGSFGAKRFKGNFRLLGIGHLSLFNDDNLQKLFQKNHFRIIKKEYPFLKTDYCNIKNIFKILNTKQISPPFYGNIMTLYGKKLD